MISLEQMDATNPQVLGDRMSENVSFGSNYQRLSQSRKISIGVLVDSIANSQTKNIKEAVLKRAEDETPSKRNCVHNSKEQTPLLKKQVTVSPENASPWVSARSFFTKPSSVAVHDAEQTSTLPRKARPGSKLSKQPPVVHSVKFFGGKKPDSESDEGRQKNFVKATNVDEAGIMNGVEHVENHLFPCEREVLPEKEPAVDKSSKTQTGGSETLRTKLWEVLENVASQNKDCPSPQPADLHPNQEMYREQGVAQKTNPSSDTIESDSERPDHASMKPVTRSSTRKKASTKKKHDKTEATNSTCHRKECLRKSMFSSGGDWPKKLYDTVNDGSLLSKNKVETETSGVEKHHQRNENTKERQQLNNKSRSISAAEKSRIQRNKAENANNPNDVTSNVHVEQESGTTKKSSFEFTHNLSTRQQRDAEISELKDQQEDIANSLLKNKRVRGSVFVEQKSATAKKNSLDYPLSISGEQHRDVESPKLKDQQEVEANSLLKNRRATRFSEKKRGTAKKRSFNNALNFTMEQQQDVEIPELKDRQEDVANSLLKNKRVRRDVFVEQRSETTKKNLFDYPINFSGLQQRDNEIPELKDQQEDMVNSVLNNKRDKVQESGSPSSETESPESSPACLQKSKEKLHEQSPTENLIKLKGIRSFKNLSNSKPAEGKSNIKGHSSFIVEERTETRLLKSSSDTVGSESSEDDSYIKGRRESETPSPETCVAELRGSDKRPCNRKSADMTGFSPLSEPSTGNEGSSEHQIDTQQCEEDGLASAVVLLTATLNRVKAKLKSVTSVKSAEILQAAAEKIFMQLHNAESEIKTDVGKLTNLGKSQRKRLETRFQEKQEQLLGIYKKFKEEVDQQLDYGSFFEDLEEHETELKESVERQRAVHKKLIVQVEQAIKDQLDDTESRLMAVHKSAKEKMLQLKLVVAECIKQGAFS